MESQLNTIDHSFDSRYSFWAREVLDEMPDCFTITDPSISGHPIVFASRGFLKMCGYRKEEVVGRNGRMFQGPMTCRRSVLEIREAVRFEKTLQISILNYRKDGRPFSMLFHMCPVFSKEDGTVIHFLSVHVPIVKKAQQRRSWSSGVTFSEDGYGYGFSETVRGYCRRDVGDSGSIAELDRGSFAAVDSDDREMEMDDDGPYEAGELEKRKAISAVSNILSVLTHYSELTGRLVCSRKCRLSSETGFPSSLNISLGRIKQSFVLTNPDLEDMPIVYASDAFLQLTGYDRHQVLGRNCRFLCGEYTDFSVTNQIKESIEAARPCTVRILNYRKDGSWFWNLLHISPVRNATGKIAYYVGVQIEEEEECSKSMEMNRLSPEQRHTSVVAVVKVSVRCLSLGAASSSK
ncbi:protein TWIN LOV 1-like [Impatiens glandulifera]|uniref:protein TWIN LOV 1-like n=1 Tax=Impatiens glandulifera TaxID=253017 RepID=UPI001FB15352|nr:protein TWIN LOV 1-like [Impatiens glandulifera]